MKIFASLPEPRTGPAQRHDLREMILMALCAVLCGANTWVDVSEWAEDQLVWLRKYIPAKAGAPSHDTSGRVFRLIDTAIEAHALVHGEEKDVFSDAGYQGVEKRAETQDIKTNWHVAMRPGKRRAQGNRMNVTRGQATERDRGLTLPRSVFVP